MARSLNYKIISTVDGGYRVYLGGKYVQRKTRLGIEQVIAEHKIKNRRLGKDLADLDAPVVSAWQALDDKCKEVGTTLEDAVAHWLPIFKAKEASRPLWDCVDEYIDEIAKRLKPPTVRDHKDKLYRFRDALGSDALISEGMTAASVRSYLDRVHTDTSARHHANTRAVISAFASWLINLDLLPSNPCTKIPKYTRGIHKEINILEPAQAKDLLRIAADSEQYDILAYIVLSLFCGLRPHEFISETRSGKLFLDWADVDLLEGVLVSAALSKTARRRRVSLPENYMMVLKSWIDFIRSKQGILEGAVCINSGFYQRFKKFKKAHLSDDFPKIQHDILRHTFGTYAVIGGLSTGDTSKIMGNSEAIVRAHYLDAGRTKSEAISYWSLLPSLVLGNGNNKKLKIV